MGLNSEQRAIRRQGVTGSEIAAVVGLSPWAGPIDVWQEKVVGRRRSEVNTADTWRGVHLEPVVVRWYVEAAKRVVADVGTVVHPDHPLVIATPDGVSQDPGGPRGDTWTRRGTRSEVVLSASDAALEVKCPSWRTAKHWGAAGTDAIPKYYYPQVVWEMAVLGLKQAHVAVFIRDEMRLYSIDWDQGVFEALLAAAEKFWRDHVETQTAPEPDSSASYAEHLAELFPSHAEDMLRADGDSALVWIRQAARAEAALREHGALLEEAKNRLKMLIGKHRGVEGEFGRITWAQNRSSKRVDWQAVASEMQASSELIKKHTSERPGARVFRANWSEGWHP